MTKKKDEPTPPSHHFKKSHPPPKNLVAWCSTQMRNTGDKSACSFVPRPACHHTHHGYRVSDNRGPRDNCVHGNRHGHGGSLGGPNPGPGSSHGTLGHSQSRIHTGKCANFEGGILRYKIKTPSQKFEFDPGTSISAGGKHHTPSNSELRFTNQRISGNIIPALNSHSGGS